MEKEEGAKFESKEDRMNGMQGRIRRKPSSRLSFAGLRRYPRKDFSAQVIVQDADGWEVPVDSLDFSPAGMFLRSDFLFEVGEVHNLIFRGPDGTDIFAVRVQVVRVETQSSHTAQEMENDFVPGMAYDFIDMAPQKQERLFELASRV